MIKQIYLITTKGCAACEIMENILREAHVAFLYTFSIYIKDISEVEDYIKTNVILTDFPTVIFIKNKVIKYHFSGTKSLKELSEIIKDLKFN